jgi:hypothetical protein
MSNLDPERLMIDLGEQLDEIIDLAVEHGTRNDRRAILIDAAKTAAYVRDATGDLYDPRPDRPSHADEYPHGLLTPLSEHLRTQAREIVLAMEAVAESIARRRLAEAASAVRWRMDRLMDNVAFKAGEAGEQQRIRLRQLGARPGGARRPAYEPAYRAA